MLLLVVLCPALPPAQMPPSEKAREVGAKQRTGGEGGGWLVYNSSIHVPALLLATGVAVASLASIDSIALGEGRAGLTAVS